MGAGESVYVQNQERFVNNNINNYKKVLPDYSNSQIKGKLRQLYANSDTCQRNKNSYILDYEWSIVKNKVTPVYLSEQERNGYRRYN
jgi:hypothetical protein